MQEQYEIQGLGKVFVEAPKSFTAMNDLYLEWVGQQSSKSKLARVNAAAVGICWSSKNKDRPPIYNLSAGEVVAYGAECLEWFFRKNVNRSDIYLAGTQIILDLVDMLPKESEVQATADSFPKEQKSGSAGAEAGEAVGA